MHKTPETNKETINAGLLCMIRKIKNITADKNAATADKSRIKTFLSDFSFFIPNAASKILRSCRVLKNIAVCRSLLLSSESFAQSDALIPSKIFFSSAPELVSKARLKRLFPIVSEVSFFAGTIFIPVREVKFPAARRNMRR